MNRGNGNANDNPVRIMTDLAVLAFACGIVMLFTGNLSSETRARCLAFVCVFAVIYILSNKAAGIYQVTFFFCSDGFWKRTTISWFKAFAVTLLSLYLYDSGNNIAIFCFSYMIAAYLLLVVSGFVSRFAQIMLAGRHAPRTALVGTFSEYERFHYYLNKTSMKTEEIGYILRGHEGERYCGRYNVLGRITDLENIIRENEIDQIFFLQGPEETLGEIEEALRCGFRMGVTMRVLIDTCRIRRSWSSVSAVGDYPLITYGNAKNEKERTDGRRSGGAEDAEVNRTGRFLRKTGLDELPQFFNVLKGNMSFVGTRHPTVEEAEKHTGDP